MIGGAGTRRTPQMRVRAVPRRVAVRTGVPPTMGVLTAVDDDGLVRLDALRGTLGARHGSDSRERGYLVRFLSTAEVKRHC